jgi:hypothetical protein
MNMMSKGKKTPESGSVNIPNVDETEENLLSLT